MRSDRRVLFGIVVLGCLIIFSAAKMAGAITGKERREPAYRSQPSQAFSQAVVDSIIEAKYLNQSRIPDDDYAALEQVIESIAEPVANLSVTSSRLIANGMDDEEAQNTIDKIKAKSDVLESRTVSVDKTFSVASVSVTSETISVATSTQIQYGVSGSNSPGLSATMSMSAQRSGIESWKITSVDLQLQDGGF